MQKIALLLSGILLLTSYSYAQETLQTVTERGNTSNRSVISSGNGIQTILSYAETGVIGTQSNHDLSIFTNLNEKVRVTTNGSVGIGTSTPKYKLDVIGDGQFNNIYATTGQITALGVSAALAFTDRKDKMKVWQWFADGNKANLYNTTYNSNLMSITETGNVGIGVANPTQRLAVNGNILAKEITVSSTSSDWPDYVFDPEYSLTSLPQIERFIQLNRHLPGVPSASTVEKEGINIGSHQATLLKKIEELTLYIIEQNKKTEKQEKKLAELEARLLAHETTKH
ncbi:putative coiled-coil protein SlyX [Pedobacter cryoconitis]|uniref:tail fiber protein n=1 Tax=Pedobacter cryoconitis TaxID=188932 RepID=UPI001819A14A|nr:tail fiber protein [Pedobacter cryoconitis]MBB6269845.1 putative coiled-coil protein SlyX [Pedobacter cryoconitis]